MFLLSSGFVVVAVVVWFLFFFLLDCLFYLFYFVLFCFVLFCFVLFACFILFYFILFYFIYFILPFFFIYYCCYLFIFRWSLGIMAYELFFGELPFYSESNAEIFSMIIDYKVQSSFSFLSLFSSFRFILFYLSLSVHT